MSRKTTQELFTEAMVRLGCVVRTLNGSPPPRKRKPMARRRATGRNGKAR